MLLRRDNSTFSAFIFGLALLALAVCPSRLAGQATELGTIAGTVTDPQGSLVPAASVKVTNTGTGVTREVTTDSQGAFAARSLVPGTYSVEVTAPAFQRQVQSNIKLDVGATATLDFHLTVGQVTDQVQVNAEAVLLQTEDSNVGTVIENAQVVELPLNGRNFNNLTRLTPGAVRGTSNGAETIQGETFAVAGDRSDNTYYSLDGMFNNGTFFKTAAIHPSIDAIQEFKIQTNTNAQYGAAAGANINVMIKSGTNGFHGTLYEFLRNDKFDSRLYFAQTKPPYRQNQFGFTVGGPVAIPKLYNGRNRTFWFFNYEGNRIRAGNSSFQTIPTPAMIAGDLSRTLTGAPAAPIFNPYSARVVNGQVVRDPFPGNIIPSNLIKPYSTAYANFWFPTNLIAGTTSNFSNTIPTARNDDQVNVRIDQKISEKNNLFGRLSWSELDQNDQANLPKASQVTFNKYVGAVLSDTHIFNPTTILNFRFGYLRANLGQGPGEHFIDVYRTAGLTNTPLNFRNFDYPINFGITGYSGPNLGNLVNGPDFTYQSSLSLNKVVGRHSFTFGYDYTRLRIFHDSVFSTFNYDNVATADPQNVSNTGQPLASFLLGLPSTANRIVGQTDLDLRQNLHHIYVQDDIKVNPKLVLNVGLRWEYDQWPHHIRGRLAGFDTLTGQFFWASTNPITGQPANVRPEVADPRYANFAPRFGFAYRLTNKTTIRSSYGIFYNSNFSWEWSDSRGNWPFSISDSATGLNIGTALTSTESLFQSFDPRQVKPQNQHTVSRDVKTPYMQNWNIGIEQQVTEDVLVQLNYQGSKGTHLGSFLSTNDPTPGPGDPDPRRPFPIAGSISELKHIATSKYDALTAKVEKRFARGFSVLGSYAYSHSIDLNSEFGGTSPQNNQCIKCDLGNSGFDQRHVANISYIYVVPAHNDWNKALRYAVGGWEVAGISTFESGRVYNVGLNFDNANVGARGNFQRPNLVGNPFPSGFKQTFGPGGAYFDTNAFQVAPRYQFGNLGRNAFHGPNFFNTDVGAFKNIPLPREGMRLQFRSEFFNAFNNVNFGNPNGTVGDPNFGQVRGTQNRSRQIQFGLKLVY
ncbi:MAG: carboxypeptidase regulatory-like domain-containing protein [Bryobacteraceae bacterium]